MSMDFAAVDIGNTSVKVKILSDGRIRESQTFDSLDAAALCLKEDGCGKVAFSTTRQLSPEEMLVAEGEGWWEFHPGVKLPVKVCYKTPEKLGPDRLAGALGASVRFKGENVLVADIGTALTTDLVGSEGEFLGGNISPGIKMRFDALNEYTSRLPLVEWKDDDGRLWGDSTESAIFNGVRWGMVNEIAGAFRLARMEKGNLRLVVTGGGARFLLEDLRKVLPEEDHPVCEPDLVAYGLMEAYNYNHDK